MTTIAYNHKDKEIAYDSRITSDGLIVSDATNKMTIKNDVMFFFCGSCCDQDLFIDYYFNIADKKTVPECHAFVVDNMMVYNVAVNDDCIVCKYEMKESYAIGSGMNFAISAMDFGCSAKEAVKYASKRDVYTGGKIGLYSIK